MPPAPNISSRREIVALTAYQLHNVHLMLVSGIGQPYDPATGKGVVGKNYCYQTMSSVDVFFDDKLLNPFIGAGALASVIDDYNGDNFDHSGLGFIGGAYIAGMVTGARPIEMARVPDGVPKWGLEWKHAATKYFLRNMGLSVHGSSYAQAGNYLSLDPTYKDPVRPADAPDDLRLSRQRPQDGEILHRSRDRDRATRWAPATCIRRRARARTTSPITRRRTTSAAR